jgi:hypothetical protein
LSVTRGVSVARRGVWAVGLCLGVVEGVRVVGGVDRGGWGCLGVVGGVGAARGVERGGGGCLGVLGGVGAARGVGRGGGGCLGVVGGVGAARGVNRGGGGCLGSWTDRTIGRLRVRLTLVLAAEVRLTLVLAAEEAWQGSEVLAPETAGER